MLFLNYSNTAPPLALSGGVTAAATTLTVSSTAGYPAAPFLLGLERGTANEEVVLCTALTATSFTVTRGYDGTTAKDHATGTLVEHTVSALVYRGAGVVRLTTAERDALAGSNLWAGRTIWNSTSTRLEVYDGTVWVATDAATATALDSHAGATSAHSATAAATAGRMVLRDAAGRAQVAAPSAAADIARLDTVTGHDTALQPHGNSLGPTAHRMVRSGKDTNGIFTTVENYRPDGTLAIRSVLSGGTSPTYTTRTVTEYAANGTTAVKTTTYNLTYDADGALTTEAFA